MDASAAVAMVWRPPGRRPRRRRDTPVQSRVRGWWPSALYSFCSASCQNVMWRARYSLKVSAGADKRTWAHTKQRFGHCSTELTETAGVQGPTVRLLPVKITIIPLAVYELSATLPASPQILGSGSFLVNRKTVFCVLRLCSPIGHSRRHLIRSRRQVACQDDKDHKRRPRSARRYIQPDAHSRAR